MTFFLRNREKLVVFLVSVFIYFMTVLPFGYFRLKDTMFWASDSHMYRAVGNWICGIGQTNATLLRPFFYPLFLNISRSFGGVYGIWFFQFLLWILGGLLVYQSVKSSTGSVVLAFIGSFIYASNITLILLTLHALTEVMTTFLLAVLVFLVVNVQKRQEIYYWPLVIFVSSLLTVTKPVYAFLLGGVLLYRLGFSAFVISRNKMQKKHYLVLLYVIFALLPVILQLSIMKIKHNRFAISFIGSRTIRLYYLPKVYGTVNHISVMEARKYVAAFDKTEAIKYVLKHYKVSLSVYFETILGNLRTKSNFVKYPRKQVLLDRYMREVNKIYYYLHLLMVIPLLLMVVFLTKKKRWRDLETIGLLSGTLYLIIFTSGITFWQGDRIVLPVLPVWITLYSLLISEYWCLIKAARGKVTTCQPFPIK